MSAGERKGYLRAQQALDNGRSYVDYGRLQVEKAVELAEVLDDTLAKEAQRSKEEFRAYQDTIIEPMRRDIMTAKAKLQDLEQRKAGLPSDSEDSAQQRKLLDIDIEGARTTLAINEIGLESLGNSTLAELLQAPTRLLLRQLREHQEEINKNLRTIDFRRRLRRVSRWAWIFVVAVIIFS